MLKKITDNAISWHLGNPMTFSFVWFHKAPTRLPYLKKIPRGGFFFGMWRLRFWYWGRNHKNA